MGFSVVRINLYNFTIALPCLFEIFCQGKGVSKIIVGHLVLMVYFYTFSKAHYTILHLLEVRLGYS